MFKERDLDKATIDAYHAYVQRGIRNDLNSISLGPGKLPYRTGVALVLFGFCFLIVGILLITLRMRHVYLWDWDAQFLGPFFFILWLLSWCGSTMLFVLAKRRSNKYRSELYFKPVGDWGVQCVHKSELVRESEMKHDLKSGTTPHKSIKPRSEAYAGTTRGRPSRDGQDNRAYDKTPDGHRGPPRDDRRGDPRAPQDRRGPPRDDRRGPPGPPRDDRDRRGPPPNGQRGPPRDPRGPPRDDRDRRGPPPPDGRRGPPPDGYRGPPREDRNRGPPPPGFRGDDRRPPQGRRSPPPQRGPHPDDRRPPPQARGPPRFGGVERIPDDERRDFKLILNKTHDESDI